MPLAWECATWIGVFSLNFNTRFLQQEHVGGRDEIEIRKLRIFHREGKTFERHGVWNPSFQDPLSSKFHNISRISPVRRGFNGVRCSGNKLEFLRLSPWYPAAVTLYTRSLRFRCFEPRVIHLFQFHFITGFESRGSLAKRSVTRNSRGRTRRVTRRENYLFTFDALSRNLAYFILKSGLLNLEWNKTGM